MRYRVRVVIKAIALFAALMLMQFPAFARGDNSPLSKEDEQFLEKAATVVNVLCANVYPAPASPIACIRQINANIFKKYPKGKARAEAEGILTQHVATTPPSESSEFSMGALVVLAECKGKKFAACTNGALHVIAGSFDGNTAYFDTKEAEEFSREMRGSFLGIGMEVDGLLHKLDPLVVVAPVEGSPAEKSGILSRDVILRINGKLASAFPDIESATEAIRGKEGTTVALTIVRDGKLIPKPFVVARERIESPSVKGQVITYNGSQFGLIAVSVFDDGVCSRIAKTYKRISALSDNKLKGLIFTVESNMGGVLPEGHCTLDLFMDAPYYILERNRDGLRPYTPPRRVLNPLDPNSGSTSVVPEFPGDITGGLPILGVGDGLSASASELVLRELQHKRRAPIAGTLTFGKGSIQNVRRIPDGLVKVTHGEFVVGSQSDWVPVQCIGVTPDILFDRGFDPKLDDGKRAYACSREGSIASGGPMIGHPAHSSFSEEALENAREMLDAYKQYLAVNHIDEKRRQRIEKFKEFAKRKKERETKKQ